MTLPRNFPGRRNSRRRGALERIHAQLKTGQKGNPPPGAPLSGQDVDRLKAEAARLEELIIPDSAARALHTKKDRSARGRFTREGNG